MGLGINNLDKNTVPPPWAVVDSSVSRWSANTHSCVGETTFAVKIPQASGSKANFWHLKKELWNSDLANCF